MELSEFNVPYCPKKVKVKLNIKMNENLIELTSSPPKIIIEKINFLSAGEIFFSRDFHLMTPYCTVNIVLKKFERG